MPGAHVIFKLGPKTFEANTTITGGQLVEPDGTTGKIKPAGANSVAVLGVAMSDAATAASNPTDPLHTAWPQPEVAVVYGPAEVDVTYAAAADFGELLVAAASGQVTPYTPGTSTFDQIVGRCTAPAGVAAAAVGPMRLMV